MGTGPVSYSVIREEVSNKGHLIRDLTEVRE